jgi:hypothetical protein
MDQVRSISTYQALSLCVVETRKLLQWICVNISQNYRIINNALIDTWSCKILHNDYNFRYVYLKPVFLCLPVSIMKITACVTYSFSSLLGQHRLNSNMSMIHGWVGLSTTNFEFRIISVKLYLQTIDYNVCAVRWHTPNNPNRVVGYTSSGPLPPGGRESVTGVLCVGSWVGLSTGLDTLEETKISCPCPESNYDSSVVQPNSLITKPTMKVASVHISCYT